MQHNIKTLSDLGRHMDFEVKYQEPKRGEIYQADLSEMAVGTIHITSKSRPCAIIQNDRGNLASGTVIIALISSKIKRDFPMQYIFNLNGTESVICFEQIMTLDKNRLVEKLGELTPKQMAEADKRLMYSLELNRFSLDNIKDIDVVSMSNVKTKEGNFISFKIELIFEYNIVKEVEIKLEKLKEFDNSIDENIEFEDLKRKLDNCKGLNWLVNNNEIK